MTQKKHHKTARRAVHKISKKETGSISRNQKIAIICGVAVLVIAAVVVLINMNKTGAAYTTVPSCEDTDGGLTYDQKGWLRLKNSDGSVSNIADYCEGNTLRELTCANQQYGDPLYKVDAYVCPNSCIDGMCWPKCDFQTSCATTLESAGQKYYCRQYNGVWQWMTCVQCNGNGCAGMVGSISYATGTKMYCEKKEIVCDDAKTWKACSIENEGRTTAVNGKTLNCYSWTSIAYRWI